MTFTEQLFLVSAFYFAFDLPPELRQIVAWFFLVLGVVTMLVRLTAGETK
jgi:hypothetical protein